MGFCIILPYVAFLKKLHKTGIIVNILFQVIIILYNASNNFYNLSYYYQLINHLNTKNNLQFLFLMLLLFLVNKKKTTFVFFFTLLFLFWINLNNIPIETTQLCLTQITNKSNINVNLLNGIMLIHPPILYYFYISYLKCMGYNIIPNIITKCTIINTKKIKIVSTILIYFSIILGCLWAEQELSWGGWWSWDFVELLALNFFIYNLYKIHTNSSILPNSGKLEAIIIIVTILTVRFNIINSIHNFVSVESQNQYFYYILIAVLIGIIYIKFLLVGNHKKTTLNIYILFIIHICILYIYFLFSLLAVDYFNIKYGLHTNIKHLYIYALLLYLVFFFLKKQHSLVFLGLTLFVFLGLSIFDSCCFLCVLLIISINTFNLKTNNYIHILLPVFFYCTIHQLYLFYFDILNYEVKTIINYKLSNIIDVFLNTTNNTRNTSLTHKNIFIFFDLHKTPFDLSTGLFKNIFEKDISTKNNLISELYSYNLQKLIQPVGLVIQVILCLIINALLYILKKNILIHI